MSIIIKSKKLFQHPHFENDEKNLAAGVLNIISIATIFGLAILLGYRLIFSNDKLAAPMAAIIVIMIISRIMISRGFVEISGKIILWTLLGFIIYIMFLHNGFHDSSIIAVPGILVVSGIVLKKKYFYFFSIITLALMILLGYLEIVGVLKNRLSYLTNFSQILDRTTILGLTTLTIMVLSDKLLSSLNYARHKEIEIKKHAEQLNEISERYKTLFEGANDAILIMKEDKFIDCNNTAVQMFGYPKENIVGRSPVNFSPKFQPDGIRSELKALNKIEKALNGNPQRFEWQHINSSGILLDTEVSLIKIIITEQIYLHAIVRDISDRKLAEKELRSSELKLRTLFNLAADPILLLEFNGNIIDSNQSACQLLGLDSQQIKNINIIDLNTEDNKPKVQERFSAIKNMGKFVFETTLTNTEGLTIPIEVNATTIEYEGRNVVLAIHRDLTIRNQAEKLLKESEEKYRRIVQTAIDGFLLLDGSGKILEINNSFCNMLGYSADELLKGHLTDSGISTRPEEINMHLKKITNNGYDRFETELKNKNGNDLIVDLSATYSKADNVFYCFVSDITEKKKYEEDLIESERRYKLLSDMAVEGIGIHQKGKLIDANETFFKLVGHKREDLIGKDVIPIIFPKDQIEYARYLNTIEREDIIETKYITSNGNERMAEFRYKEMDYKGIRVRFSSMYDITEREKFEKSLKESEEKFRQLFQTSPNIIVISVIENGLIIDINDEGAKILGFKKEEMLGKTSIELGVAKPEMREAMKEIIEKEKSFRLVEQTLYKKNHEPLNCLLSGQLINIEDKTYLFQTIVDITKMKQSEEKLIKYQQNLKTLTSELNLAEERERRRIAINLHDHLTQSLAMTKIKLASIQKEIHSDVIKNGLKEARRYLDESIKNSRKITYELSPPILYELGLPEAVEWLLKQVESDNKIKTIYKSDLDYFYIDNDNRILLFRSINELINNSIKHSGCKTISVYLWRQEDNIFAEVIDDGIGFEPDKIAGKNPGEGGFGLFSLKERLEFLNGSVRISSSPGRGTDVTLSLLLKKASLKKE